MIPCDSEFVLVYRRCCTGSHLSGNRLIQEWLRSRDIVQTIRDNASRKNETNNTCNCAYLSTSSILLQTCKRNISTHCKIVSICWNCLGGTWSWKGEQRSVTVRRNIMQIVHPLQRVLLRIYALQKSTNTLMIIYINTTYERNS